MSRVLIQGGCVLTLGSKLPNFPRADVLLEDGVIVDVGPDLRARDAEKIDAAEAIVMPAFVDTHRHACWSLLRNLGASPNGIDVGHFRPDDVYAATLISLLGAVEAGIATVVDWVNLPAEQGFADAVIQAHADSGINTVIVYQSPGENNDDLRAGLAAYGSPGSKTAVALGTADVTRAGLDRVESEWATAREMGMRIHAHAGLAESESGAVADLARRGVLGPDVTLVHCSHLGDDDFDAISVTGAGVAVAPSSEMAGGLGAPPLQKMLDRRILPGLAVDDERVAPGDLLSQMRIANSVQHAAYFDLKLAGKAGLPNLLTTRDVIRYATLQGATTVGLAATTGSLEPGKRADVIVLRTDRPNIYPINDPIGAVVWGVDTSNLAFVFAGGRAVMSNGRLEADVESVAARATAARDRVLSAAGYLTDATSGETR